MQCKRCKTFFKYDKYDGICPQCAYFNRPPGMEEVDLFEDDKRFQAENYVLPQMEGIHMELHKKYDSDKKPHKKKKTAKNNAGHFSDYLERKAKENMETKKDAANSRVRIIICLIVAIIAILFQIFEKDILSSISLILLKKIHHLLLRIHKRCVIMLSI